MKKKLRIKRWIAQNCQVRNNLRTPLFKSDLKQWIIILEGFFFPRSTYISSAIYFAKPANSFSRTGTYYPENRSSRPCLPLGLKNEKEKSGKFPFFSFTYLWFAIPAVSANAIYTHIVSTYTYYMNATGTRAFSISLA